MKVLECNNDYYKSCYNNKIEDLLTKHKFKMCNGSYYYDIIAFPKNDPDSWIQMSDHIDSNLFINIDTELYDVDYSCPTSLLETYNDFLSDSELITEKKAYESSLKKDNTLNTPIGILMNVSMLKYSNLYFDDIYNILHENDVDNMYHIANIITNPIQFGINISSKTTIDDICIQKHNLDTWVIDVRNILYKNDLISKSLGDKLIYMVKDRVLHYLDNLEDMMSLNSTFADILMPDANEKISNVIITEWGGEYNKLYFETPNYYYYFDHGSD